MIGWLTATVIVILAVLAIWALPRLAAGRKVAAQSGELTEALRVLARSLGLECCDRRTLFGDLVHRLRGDFNRLSVEMEVQVGRSCSFTRITIEFPQPIDQELTILSERKPALRNWLLRQREVEIDDEEFDRDFILLARHEKRLEAILSPAIRFQLRRLMDRVDKLEVGDHALHVMALDMTDPEQVSSLLKKAVETAERVYATSMQLGPSPSRVEASVYSQATADIYSREEEPASGDASPSSSSSSSSSTLSTATAETPRGSTSSA